MKEILKIMGALYFLGAIIGVVSVSTTIDASVILGDYQQMFSTYPLFALLTFFATAIMFVLLYRDHPYGYGMLAWISLLGLLAFPIGTIVSVITIIIFLLLLSENKL